MSWSFLSGYGTGLCVIGLIRAAFPNDPPSSWGLVIAGGLIAAIGMIACLRNFTRDIDRGPTR